MTDPRDGQHPGSGQPWDPNNNVGPPTDGQGGFPTPDGTGEPPAAWGAPQPSDSSNLGDVDPQADAPTQPPTTVTPDWHAPTAPAGWGAQSGEDAEYYIHSSEPPTSFQDAPDPFAGAPTAAPMPQEPRKSRAKALILSIAALVVVAAVAVGAYFVFFSGDDDADSTANNANESGQQDERADETDSASDAPSESDAADDTAVAQEIEGTYSVNGTIESYTGPATGQLGGSPRQAGEQAFTKPQTWTIEDCTATTCELTVEESGLTITLELADGVWAGESTDQIACTPTAGAMIDATFGVEIPEEGGTATRTMSASCDDPIEEVDSLTLEPA